MIDLTIEEIKKIQLDGRKAAQYAWDHYEELVEREKVYTLYGPYAYGIGAGIPWGFIPKSSRNLTMKTRRKNYNIYELDGEYRLLRVRQVCNSVNNHTYECFELDGVQYACPFLFNRKERCRSEVIAVEYKDGSPCFLGFLSKNVVYAHFLENVSQEKVFITSYSYNPISEYTPHGYITDINAPIGALNSAVQRVCREEEKVYTDFSQWFK